MFMAKKGLTDLCIDSAMFGAQQHCEETSSNGRLRKRARYPKESSATVYLHDILVPIFVNENFAVKRWIGNPDKL